MASSSWRRTCREYGPANSFRKRINRHNIHDAMETFHLKNLDDLVVFLRAIDRGSFSAAARELHLAPGTVSKQIARLEQLLDVRLFERSTRKVKLTDEGRAVAVHARQALLHLEQAAEVAAESRRTLTGTLRVTAPAPFGRKYVASAIADFRKKNPSVDFELHLSDQIVDLLTSDFDLAIRLGNLPDSGLIARRLAPNRRVLTASPAFIDRHGTPESPADLTRFPCLVMAYPGSLQNVWPLVNGNRRAHVAVAGGLRSDSGEVLREWCLAGLGISMRETWDVAEEIASGRLVRVLPAWEAERSRMVAVHAERNPMPRRLAAFVEFLRKRWDDPPWERTLS
jgi:DNA-binding transcriptional LysR family regulator